MSVKLSGIGKISLTDLLANLWEARCRRAQVAAEEAAICAAIIDMLQPGTSVSAGPLRLWVQPARTAQRVVFAELCEAFPDLDLTGVTRTSTTRPVVHLRRQGRSASAQVKFEQGDRHDVTT